MTTRRTLILAVAYVLLLAVVAFGVPLAISLRDRVDAEVRGQARSQADLLAASAPELLEPARRTTLDRLVATSAESVRGRVIVTNRRGTLIADSAGDGEIGSDFASRPEITSALAGSTYQETRHSDTLNADLLATAVPILHNGEVVGAVRITQSVAAVNDAVRRSVIGIVLLALAVLALGVIAGALIAQRIARPIGRLAEAADDVAGGDLEARAPVEGTTEQRSLANSFNEMTGRVGRMLDSQREFVADASHELRTPLTGLRLQLEEIDHLASSADEREAAGAALHEVDRLSAIVEELLVLSRAGEHELPAERIDLGQAADRAAARWQRRAEAKGVGLLRESGPGSIVEAAGADLDRALDSLIENAIVYSPAGTEIEIVDGSGAIAVRDRGPGLAPGEEEAVLERFYRGRAGRQGAEGTGLGLPIAAELAGQWGGSVAMSNRPGGGAEARLSLPVASRREPVGVGS
jgi:two-component system, OmpR family, sensor kinase